MDVVAETVETTTVYSLSLYFCVVEVVATAQAVVVVAMTAQALSGAFSTQKRLSLRRFNYSRQGY